MNSNITPTLPAGRPPIEGLTVTGEAAQDISPEVIELGFDIHSAGLSAAIALQENSTKAKYITQALVANGGAETDVVNVIGRPEEPDSAAHCPSDISGRVDEDNRVLRHQEAFKMGCDGSLLRGGRDNRQGRPAVTEQCAERQNQCGRCACVLGFHG